MKIEIIKCLQDNFSYLIFDEKSNKISVVDPSESSPVINFLEKKKLNLNYILNTHHHFDHIGGNLDLKKKYNSKIIGFEGDKNRIPGIDIALSDNQNYKIGSLEFKIIHIPGHTSGHICFYFHNNKVAFTGDTIFSLGCGRIFEGDYKQMFDSINKIKNLPPDTKIYFGHEYTLKNSEFCIKYDPDNQKLIEKIKDIKFKKLKNIPSAPSKIKDEMETNIFFRTEKKNIKTILKMKNCDPLKVFTKLRDLKDSF